MAGRLSSSYRRDDADDKFFVNKLYRTMKKVTTNWLRAETPSAGVVYGEGPGEYWAGHDALRWCSEKPRRMLDGTFRPASDWVFPDLPWYSGEIPPDTYPKGRPPRR